MFLLTNRTPADKLTAEEKASVETALEQARETLADSSAGLVFNAEQHRYYLGNREMRSVSSIVQHYAPFDAAAKAEACSKNPRSPLYGIPVEDILANWEAKRDAAAERGTAVHAFGEACCLFRLGQEERIDDEYKSRITADGLVAETPKEEAVAKWWQALDLNRYAIVAKETTIVNPVLSYAGTFDLLLYDIASKTFCLRDYKTNEDLFKFYGEMLRAPLCSIKANDAGKYTLQQNLYRIQLINIGLPVSEMKLIWLKDDSEYEEVTLDDRENLIRYAMENFPIKD